MLTHNHYKFQMKKKTVKQNKPSTTWKKLCLHILWRERNRLSRRHSDEVQILYKLQTKLAIKNKLEGFHSSFKSKLIWHLQSAQRSLTDNIVTSVWSVIFGLASLLFFVSREKLSPEFGCITVFFKNLLEINSFLVRTVNFNKTMTSHPRYAFAHFTAASLIWCYSWFELHKLQQYLIWN